MNALNTNNATVSSVQGATTQQIQVDTTVIETWQSGMTQTINSVSQKESTAVNNQIAAG
jgi:capsule polysaccharide export protein KpsE/RkpR